MASAETPSPTHKMDTRCVFASRVGRNFCKLPSTCGHDGAWRNHKDYDQSEGEEQHGNIMCVCATRNKPQRKCTIKPIKHTPVTPSSKSRIPEESDKYCVWETDHSCQEASRISRTKASWKRNMANVRQHKHGVLKNYLENVGGLNRGPHSTRPHKGHQRK